MPAPSEGVTDLAFRDIFVMPHGPQGARYTEKALGLAGARVRMIGYMVKRASYTPGQFLFTVSALTLHDKEMGLCDDLPMSTTFVSMPRRGTVTHLPGPLVIVGTLSLETRAEADDRTSYVQLALEEVTTLADLLAPVVEEGKPATASSEGSEDAPSRVPPTPAPVANLSTTPAPPTSPSAPLDSPK